MNRLVMSGATTVAFLLLSGCTGDVGAQRQQQAGARDTAKSPESPACGAVWQSGERLSRAYQGCRKGGSTITPALLACKDGTTFTSYDDRYCAIVGRRIAALHGGMPADKLYTLAYEQCLGDDSDRPNPQGSTAQPEATRPTTAPQPSPTIAASPSAYRDGHIWLTTELEGLDVPEVRAAQLALNSAGFSVIVDGSYGPQTAASVTQFQRLYGLFVDGIVGPETYSTLMRVSSH